MSTSEIKHYGDPSQSSDELETQLQTLHEQYLRLLDDYMTARYNMGQRFAAGFLALADANFTAPAHVHYGQNYYDQRMKASRVVEVGQNEAGVTTVGIRHHETLTNSASKAGMAYESLPSIQIEDSANSGRSNRDERKSLDGQSSHSIESFASLKLHSRKSSKNDSEAAKDKARVPSENVDAPQEHFTKDDPGDEDDCKNEDEGKDVPQLSATDPLRWFGMFVSPKLRQTQSHFAAAVDQDVLVLISRDHAMCELRRQICQKRQDIYNHMRRRSCQP